jgi:hypothetical protein
MFRKRAVPLPPPLHATSAHGGPVAGAPTWYSQAVLALTPDEFNRVVANGPEGPFVDFDPAGSAPADPAREAEFALDCGWLPTMRPTRLCYWQIT